MLTRRAGSPRAATAGAGRGRAQMPARAQGREPAQAEDGGAGGDVGGGGEDGLAGEDGGRAQADLHEHERQREPGGRAKRASPSREARRARRRTKRQHDEGARAMREVDGHRRLLEDSAGGTSGRTCRGKSGTARPAPMCRMTAPSTSWPKTAAVAATAAPRARPATSSRAARGGEPFARGQRRRARS